MNDAWLRATGQSLLEFRVVVLLSVGLLQVSEEGPAFTIIALFAAIFLLWMGWGMVRNPPGGYPPPAGAHGPLAAITPVAPYWGERS